MMINKRLINSVGESKKYVAANVLFQWCSLAANIVMMITISIFLERLYLNQVSAKHFYGVAAILVFAVIIRFVCTKMSAKMSYLSSKAVKTTLRQNIYEKLLRLGASYKESINTSEIVQVAVEGVDQLETYFGAYLPQFFYSMLAPLTLFVVISFINMTAAVVLLICVPLIPVSIAVVQTWAKKLLSKYWGQYTALGDTFLENLQGLTTLKIYQTDENKYIQMNEESERFRKITMKVLTMQLNSITIMDLIAYGGAALGAIISVIQFKAQNITLSGCLLIILLAADFFIPMRLLGSFFHIAMNGMAASDKIFRLLDLKENKFDEDSEINKSPDRKYIQAGAEIVCKDLSFSYDETRQIIKNVNFKIESGKFTALVGESGCGKSTLASLIMGKNKKYTGSIKIGNVELKDIAESELMNKITYIGHNSYLFKKTVRDNLCMGKQNASDEELWEVLKAVKLDEFIKNNDGLDTVILSQGANLSGGQRQRLALARALLHNTEVYIFDEATSNIDVESENDIMALIYELAKYKTVLLISHRLANVVNADCIYVVDKGEITESGTHNKLTKKEGDYFRLWNAQQKLESN